MDITSPDCKLLRRGMDHSGLNVDVRTGLWPRSLAGIGRFFMTACAESADCSKLNLLYSEGVGAG